MKDTIQLWRIFENMNRRQLTDTVWHQLEKKFQRQVIEEIIDKTMDQLIALDPLNVARLLNYHAAQQSRASKPKRRNSPPYPT